MTKKTETEIAVIDFTKFDIAQLPELKGKKNEIAKLIKANPIIEVTDNASYELAKKSRTAVKSLRTSLEKEKKDVNDRIKNNVLLVVANEYDSLITNVKKSEFDRQVKVDDWEEKKENERLEKVRLEQERVDNIKNLISEFAKHWNIKISVLKFNELNDFKTELGEAFVNFDRSNLAEYEVLLEDQKTSIYAFLEAKSEQLEKSEEIRLEQIRIAEELEKQRVENEALAEFMRIEREEYLAKQKAIAEKNRLEQEKFLEEKRLFEEQQLSARAFVRCRQLMDLGFTLNTSNNAYQKGLHYLNLEDVKSANEEMWERELEDAKNVKDYSELATDNVNNFEVEFEEVEYSQSAEENYHEDDVDQKSTKGLSTRLKAANHQIKKELTWDDIFNEINLHLDWKNYLKETYNVPTLK